MICQYKIVIYSFRNSGKEYVAAFKKVNNYEDLNAYITEDLTNEYTQFKSSQLDKDNQLKAVKSLQAATDSIFKISAFDKESKKNALTKFQNNFTTYKTSESLLSYSFTIIYTMFAIAGIAIVFFIIFGVCTDFKNSSTILIILGGLAIIGLICFLIAQPDVNNIVFANLSISPTLPLSVHVIKIFLFPVAAAMAIMVAAMIKGFFPIPYLSANISKDSDAMGTSADTVPSEFERLLLSNSNLLHHFASLRSSL